MGTARQPWAVIHTNSNAYEIWAARQPQRPTSSGTLRLGTLNNKKEATYAVNVLNQVWDVLQVCLNTLGNAKTTDPPDVMATHYQTIDEQLTMASFITSQAGSAFNHSSVPALRRLFQLMHRAVRECSASLVRYERARNEQDHFTGLLRLQATLNEMVRQIKVFYQQQR